MKNSNSLNLIDGNFTVDEAEEILTNIFLAKIHYHEAKNFSSYERFGKRDEIALTRIPQLKKELEKVLQIISHAKLNNKNLAISSEISLSFSDK